MVSGDNSYYDPYTGAQGPTDSTTPAQKRWNTTPNWQDPFNPPSPGDPYWAEWSAANPDYAPSSTNHPWPTPPGPGPGPGPTNPGPNGLPSPFTSPFTAPPPVNLGGPAGIPWIPQTPVFHPPTYTAPAPFQAPSMADVVNDPGFASPLHEGLGAISNSEAARGLWATGGTGKAMQDYAQNYTNRFYGDIYNRNAGTYMMNVGTQNVQPYQFAYQAAKDAFAPQMLGYQTQAAAGQRAQEQNYSNAFEKWMADFNQKYQTGRYLFDVQNA